VRLVIPSAGYFEDTTSVVDNRAEHKAELDQIKAEIGSAVGDDLDAMMATLQPTNETAVSLDEQLGDLFAHKAKSEVVKSGGKGWEPEKEVAASNSQNLRAMVSSV
jgi:hypothetical protein